MSLFSLFDPPSADGQLASLAGDAMKTAALLQIACGAFLNASNGGHAIDTQIRILAAALVLLQQAHANIHTIITHGRERHDQLTHVNAVLERKS